MVFGIFVMTLKNAAAVVPIVLLASFQVINDVQMLIDRTAKIIITPEKIITEEHIILLDQIRSIEVSWDIISGVRGLVFPRYLRIRTEGKSKPVRIDVHRFYSKRAPEIKKMVQRHLESKK